MIYSLGLSNEFGATAIELSIMLQVVHTNLEAVADQLIDKFFGDLVRTFWDEVERGSKTQVHFHLGELSNAVEAHLRFYVMGKNQGELLTLGPPDPAFRSAAS